MSSAQRWKTDLRTLRATISFVAAAATAPVLAAEMQMFPETKVQVSVVQWSPTKGTYENSPALGGEFVISSSGMLVLPVVGAIDVAKLDSKGVAEAYAGRLQSKTGLLDKPEVIVSILEYPPVYVLGDVTAPGEYKFRPGLFALQALAMSGGVAKDEKDSSEDRIRLVSDLRSAKSDILRSQARIDRLSAEMSDSEVFQFPLAEGDDEEQATLAGLYERENVIFQARKKEMQRQVATLNELRELLNAEIDALNQKADATGDAITTTENELNNVRGLVEKGVVILSRQTDLERVLSGLRSDRLDQVTAVMRARQSIAETTRNIDGLRDERQTEVATLLQTERANLDQAELKRDLAQKLLLKGLEDDAGPAQATAAAVDVLTIVRNENGDAVEIHAVDETPLRPGDVLKVNRTATVAPESNSLSKSAEIQPQKLSQIEP